MKWCAKSWNSAWCNAGSGRRHYCIGHLAAYWGAGLIGELERQYLPVKISGDWGKCAVKELIEERDVPPSVGCVELEVPHGDIRVLKIIRPVSGATKE